MGDIDKEAIALVTELCKLTEKLALKAYRDPLSVNGKPITNGYGATKNRTGRNWLEGETITDDESLYLLRRDVEDAYWPCATIPYWQEMNAHQRAALADLNYNEGYTYGDGDHDTLDRVLADKAYKHLGDTLQLYSNGYQLGLSRRRYAEWLLWQGMGPKEAYFTAWAKNSVEEIMEAIAQ